VLLNALMMNNDIYRIMISLIFVNSHQPINEDILKLLELET